jgi:hypothetical protein
MDKKELVLQIEELEERIAPTVAACGDASGSGKSGSAKSDHSGSGSGKSDHSGSGSGKSGSGGSAKC